MKQEEKLRTKEQFLKEGINWLFNRYEKCSDRYIDDEAFIMYYMDLPFWKRVLFGNKILMNHLIEIEKKYKL